MAESPVQLGLVGDAQGWHLNDLARAAQARGHRVVTISWAELCSQLTTGEEQLGPAAAMTCDALVIRGMPRGGLEEVVFRMNAIARLEAAGRLVVNSGRSLEIAIDKYLTTARLVDNGLPVPRTVVTQKTDEIRATWHHFDGDMVAKPLFGSCGRGLARLASEADLEAYLEQLPSESPAYLQEFVPHPSGDIRILLVGERAFAIRRRSDEWRTNVSLGGTAERLQPTAEMLDLARRAAAAAGTLITGVDLLPAADGRLLVLEVNAVPGWKAVAAACETDIAAEVVSLFERTTA